MSSASLLRNVYWLISNVLMDGSLLKDLGREFTGRQPTFAGQRPWEALAQKMLMRNSPATTMTAKVTPWIEKAACFEPPEPSTFDISPNAVKDSTRSAIPTVRGFVVSMRVRTTKPDTMSRIPLRRSQARVSGSGEGSLRPKDTVI